MPQNGPLGEQSSKRIEYLRQGLRGRVVCLSPVNLEALLLLLTAYMTQTSLLPSPGEIHAYRCNGVAVHPPYYGVWTSLYTTTQVETAGDWETGAF